ncbi:MAG TPA: hypothetical protein VGO13_07280 [Solirubrobacterales bacterium]|jgi:hypothetical protein|nr:hypothetical protein [Solirubrobacterales bacterium]
MIHKRMALGLTLAAVLAMSAIGASAVQAATSGLDIGESPAVLTGSLVSAAQPHTWVYGAAVVKCEEGNLEATVAGTVSEPKNVHEATVTGTYSKCKLAGTAAEVRMNGCKYTWTDTPTSLTFEVDVTACTSGKVIEIASLVNCTLTIKEQGPLSHVVFENVVGSVPAHVVANWTIKNTHVVFDGTECPVAGGTTIANGEFSGKTTVKAFKDEGLQPEKVEFKHKFQPFKDGAQTSLVAT